jgi:hypothetical protein
MREDGFLTGRWANGSKAAGSRVLSRAESLSLWPPLKHATSLPDRQPRPWALPDEIGEDRPRLVETAAGEQHALDPLLVLGPELDLVEIPVIRDQRLVSLFVGPLGHSSSRPLRAAGKADTSAASRRHACVDRDCRALKG